MIITRNNIKYELDKENKTATVLGLLDVEKCPKFLKIPSLIAYLFQKYTVVEIASNAFSGMLVETVSLPATIKTIGTAAFGVCDFLTSIEFDKNDKDTLTIYSGAFALCRKLKSVLGNRIIEFNGSRQFQMCYELSNFNATILGVISESSFSNTKLKNFVFHKEHYVEKDAFHNVEFEFVVLLKDVTDKNFENTFVETIHAETILCQSDSPFVNLAFDGYCVKIYEQ